MDFRVLEAAVRDIDTVFHVAGATRSPTDEGYYQGNVTGTVNLVKAVLSVNPTLNRFVYVSSQAAAGPSFRGEPVRESDEAHPLTPYGASKLAGEEAVLAFSSQMPVTVIRPPSVYGPRDRGFLDAFRMIQSGIIPVLGWRKRYVSVIYIDDLIDGLMNAAVNENAVDQTYFMVSDPPFYWQQLSQLIADNLEKKPLVIHLPVFLAYLFIAVHEWFAVIRGRIPRLTRQKIRQFRQRYWVCDSRKARQELKFRPRVTLEEGIERTADWYREVGWLNDLTD
jgi:nucleoside-diphosphate-sugar epimerase